MLLRLRSPIFDHGTLGIPVRKQPRRAGPKEEQELAEFREMSNAVEEASAASLSKEAWRSAANKYLGWAPVEADLHAELFETMWRVELSQKIPDVVENEDVAKRLRFALFVSVQLYELHRPRRTSSMDLFNIHSVPEASSEQTQQEETDPRQLVLESRKQEWTHRLAFIKRRIGDIVEMLTKLSGAGSVAATAAVPRQVLDALGFLIAGTDRNGQRASRLSDTFFSESGMEWTVASVSAFLSEQLVADETRNPQWSSFDMSRTWNNASSLSPPSRGAPTMIRGACQQELVVVPPPEADESVGDLKAASATIVAASHGAQIVCLTSATYAHIIGCSDCVIYLGPVFGVLSIEHCERVRIHGMCGRVRLVNCVDVRLNVWTGARPVLLGDCRGIVSGPLAMRYRQLPQYATAVCPSEQVVSGSSQAWRHPVLVDAGGVDEDDLESAVFAIQNPDDFVLEPLTALLGGSDPSLSDTSAISAMQEASLPPLPSEYSARLVERKLAAQAVMDSVKDTASQIRAAKGNSSAAAANKEMHTAMQAAFKDWLVSSGHLDVLLSRYVTTVPNSSASVSE